MCSALAASLGHTSEDPLTHIIYWTVWEWKCWACEYSQWCVGKIFQCSEWVFSVFCLEFFFPLPHRMVKVLKHLGAAPSACPHTAVYYGYLLLMPTTENTGFLAGSLAADHLLLPPAHSLLLEASQSICLFSLPILIWSSLPQPWGQPAWWHYKCPAQKWRHLRKEKLGVLWISANKHSLCLRLPVGISYWFISIIFQHFSM